MKRNRRQRAALFTCLLLVGLIGGTALWLRAQRRQYALNRALIAALVAGDHKKALALVNNGADPNTRYKATPVPSLPELVKRMLQRSPMPGNDNQTALLIACGAPWNKDNDTILAQLDTQDHRPDAPQLVQAMLKRGAVIDMKGLWGRTPLICAVISHRPNTVRLLLEHGASVNVTDIDGSTALDDAVFNPDTEVIRQLLVHGADPNDDGGDNTTPIMMAQQIKRPDLVALLKQYGAKDTGKRP